MRSDFIDLEGKKFHRWTVLAFAGKNKHGQAMWLCRCDCGTERVVRGSGKIFSKSCGCLQKERTAQLSRERNKTHGESKTQLYRMWSAMKRRCDNENTREYKWYGGRGIKYCAEWTKYENFKKWAESSGYKPGLTIDRKDPNGDYTPSNCHWIPLEKQQRNRRNNIWIKDADGKSITLADLARKTGISDKLIYQRYHQGARTVEELTKKQQPLSIEHNGRKITLKEIAEKHGLNYRTVWSRYNRGKRTYEELSKGV